MEADIEKSRVVETEVLILGTGIAGCAAALELAEKKERKILLVTKDKDIHNSATKHAQGGIIARGINDSSEKLKRDILVAGDGVCDERAVDILCEEGPALVQEMLIDRAGVEFNRTAGKLDYTREAAHSESRILYNGDHTGEEIETKITAAISKASNIEAWHNHTLIDLMVMPEGAAGENGGGVWPRCVGAQLLDNDSGEIINVLAKKVLLATGGVGQVYRRTTSPEVATGDGVATAYRAGAEIENAEYVQFHPTSLFRAELDNFLISESVRGEGAQLKNERGERFMDKIDARGSLAPRDVVARGVYAEIAKGKSGGVYLDLKSHMDAEAIKQRFPLIYATCLKCGINITREMIPVAPTAHYFCGGVKVDEWGRTNVENLYAAGEVSCTGLHGANRLASTSLLEGLVWGVRAARDISSHIAEEGIGSVPEMGSSEHAGEKVPDRAYLKQEWSALKSIMWQRVGIVRQGDDLEKAVAELERSEERIVKYFNDTRLTRATIELRNGVQTALLIARSARDNPVSRGCHFRVD